MPRTGLCRAARRKELAVQWQLSEEQDAYQKTFRAWLADVAPSEVVRGWLDRGDAVTFVERLVHDGWAGVGVPETVGGQGGGLVELALTAELLAGASAPSAAWLATVLAVPALGSRTDVAAAAFTGEHITLLSPADLVPGDGDRLVLDGKGWIHGTVPRVLAGDAAARFVAVVGTPDGRRELRLVSAREGVRTIARRLLDRSRSVADVVLEAAPSEPLDADVSQFLDTCAARAAVLVAADSLGAMERMLDMAVTYSKHRHQFGVPIGSFQAVKHAAASILVDVEAARSVVYFAAASVDDRGPLSALHAAAAKAQVTAAGTRTGDAALTLHGAIGYTWEHDLHLFYKRAKLDEHLFGAPKTWNERLADRLPLIPA
jgi:alkylation response protein AidB-like acyl-CoA dehydrogenase